MAYDSDKGLVYLTGESGLFGVYNRTSNSTENLNATDPGNWIGTTNLFSLTYNPGNKLIYLAGGSGIFGAYNRTSNTTTTISCTESWTCTAWSTCASSIQTRTCTDVNSCGSSVSKPAVSQTCAGGGGGVTAGQPTQTHSWSVITENEPVTMTIVEPEIDLTQITITTTETVIDALITVTAIDVTPQSDIRISISGMNYQGFKIDTLGINDTNIANVTIGFKVNKTWIEENYANYDSVTLYRKTEPGNQWNALNTTLINEDSDYYYFSSTSPGFSLFVVLLDLSICNNNGFCEPELGEDEVNCSNDCTEKKGFFETLKAYLWNGIIIVLAVAIVATILIIRVKRKKQRKGFGKVSEEKEVG